MAGEAIAPDSEAALVDALAAACADKRTLEIAGAGTKRGLGRPVNADATLSLAGLSGITYYEPGELVMETEAGTPLAEIEAVLAEHRQQLAFEPPDLGPLYGGAAQAGTIGGVFACNLSGPRRPFAGAARDHLLGVRAVSGRGEAFMAGGRVVKNVTGYDMGKLLAGSFGTLAVLSRVIFKVLPRAEQQRTVLLTEASAAVLDALAIAAGETWEITGAACVPAAAAARSSVSYVAGAGGAVAAVRLEGRRGAVAERAAVVRGRLAEFGATEELHTHNSLAFWREVRDGALLPPAAPGAMLWRLSVPPASAGAVRDAFADRAGAELLFDWSGGLAWLALPGGDAAPQIVAERVRDVAAAAGGHATLWRADERLRAAMPVFTPRPAALAGVERRIKANFDPHGILNPGRMYESV